MFTFCFACRSVFRRSPYRNYIPIPPSPANGWLAQTDIGRYRVPPIPGRYIRISLSTRRGSYSLLRPLFIRARQVCTYHTLTHARPENRECFATETRPPLTHRRRNARTMQSAVVLAVCARACVHLRERRGGRALPLPPPRKRFDNIRISANSERFEA